MVNQLQLSKLAKEKVQQAAQVHGQQFGQTMHKIDGTILQQLQHMLAV